MRGAPWRVGDGGGGCCQCSQLPMPTPRCRCPPPRCGGHYGRPLPGCVGCTAAAAARPRAGRRRRGWEDMGRGGGGAHWEALGNRGYQGTRPSLPAAAEVPPPLPRCLGGGVLLPPPPSAPLYLAGGGGGLVNQPPRGDLCLGCVSSKPAFSGGVRFGGNPLYTPPPQEHLPWGSPTTLLEVSALGGESLQTLLGVLSPRRGLPSQQWDLPRVVGRGHIPPPPPPGNGAGGRASPGGVQAEDT